MEPKRVALAAVAAALCVASGAHAGPWSLAPGEYYAELSGSFYSAGTFYDDAGARRPLGGLAEQRAVASRLELGWRKRASLQLTLPALSVTSRPPAGLPATSTGFGDFGLGLRYGLWTGRRAVALQFQWTTPTGYDARIQPGLGDGHQKLDAELELGSPLGRFGFLQAGAGARYDYRTLGGRSTALTGAFGSDRDWANDALIDGAIGLWLGGGLQVAGVYQGAFVVNTGRAILDAQGNPEELKVDDQQAGVRVTYRVDDRLDAFAGSWHSPGGRNVLHLDQFYCGVAWKQTRLGRNQGFLGSARP